MNATAQPHRRRALLGASIAALALSSCISSRRPVVLDSTPPGAVVYVDGESSGHSTPCTIDLKKASRTLEFRLPGYEPEVRQIKSGDYKQVVYWRDASSTPGSWTFPFFLGTEDFFFPIKNEDGEMPHRIHVRMTREAEPIASIGPFGPALGMAR